MSVVWKKSSRFGPQPASSRVRPMVTCLSHGGHVADKLQREGHQVLVANGDPQRLHVQLQQLSPQIVNSHYASLPALEAANKLGRPIVETIHNTYVWLDAERWKIEAQREPLFAKGLAVSALVKRYYHAHNPQLAEDKVVVVGNAIDPDRIIPVEQKIARALRLGFRWMSRCFSVWDGTVRRKISLA